MTDEELIRGCIKYDRQSQRTLFEMYSGPMMELCVRYAKNYPEAKEILLSGFKNIFSGIRRFSDENAKRKKDAPPASLSDWIKKEIILAAVQHMHNNKREYFVSSTVSMRDSEKSSGEEISDEKIMKSADRQIILKALHQLTPSYRAVYNMHELDGYPHSEISKLLDISEYSSKDSLSKAKFNLRKNIAGMLPK